MLFESAARLALVEALAPTSSVQGAGNFPTMAAGNVFDSRRVALADFDLSAGKNRVAVISVYSGQSESVRRGDASPVDDRAATVTLELIVELAIRFDAEGGFVDADVANDAEAELKLSTIVAQIRRVIDVAPEGHIFRKVTQGSVIKFASVPDVMPETGLRMARRFVTIEVDIHDDDYAADGGLPEPLATLNSLLPADSYAKSQISELALLFEALPSDPLEGVSVTANGGPDASGQVTFNQGE